MHAPLQNLIAAARAAEKRAKKHYNKSAFAVSLLKRSGETTEWGARWCDGALELSRRFRQLRENEALSGKFPYALAELLEPYREWESGTSRTEKPLVRKDGFNIEKIFELELQHVCVRQGRKGWADSDEGKKFMELAINNYLGALLNAGNRRLADFVGPFVTTAFLDRGAEN
jgi:CRISPR-associated protein Cmr2